MRWVRQVAHIGDEKYKKILEGRNHLEDLHVDVNILQWTLKETGSEVQLLNIHITVKNPEMYKKMYKP
jgi:hypothetical protein